MIKNEFKIDGRKRAQSFEKAISYAIYTEKQIIIIILTKIYEKHEKYLILYAHMIEFKNLCKVGSRKVTHI